MNAQLLLLELACSRLCHDLISTVGAINNGVELIEEMGAEASDEALALVAGSARLAQARLQMLRLAYGAAGRAASLGPGDVDSAAQAYFAGGKITYSWPELAARRGRPTPPGLPKVLANGLILAGELLGGKSGTITVSDDAGGSDGAGGTLRILAEGEGIRAAREIDEALAGTAVPAALTPRSAHAFLTGQFARMQGLELSLSATPGASAVITIAHYFTQVAE